MTIINQLTSFKLSGITFLGTSQQLNYTSGVTGGSIIANKAVVVDANRDLLGSDTNTRIRNLTLAGALSAVTITGTISTANQPNITTLGTLTNLTIANNLNLINHNFVDTGLMLNGNIVQASAHELNYNVVTPGIAGANKTLVLDGSRMVNNIHAITLEHIYLNDLYISSTLVTATATELNYVDITSIGQGQASKALVLDTNRNITNINSLTTTTLIATNINVTSLTGTIQTASQPNITSLGTLTSLALSGAITGVTNLSTTNLTLNGTLITSSASEINILTGVTATANQINFVSGVTAGTALASKALVLDTNRNITNINSMTLNGINDVLTITNNTASARTNIRFINDSRSWELGSNGSTATPTNCFYLYDNIAASNRFIVYSSGNIDIVAHNSSTTGLMLGGSLITSSSAELNVLDGITSSTVQLNYLSNATPGAANTNTALVLDSSLNISGINNINSTSICLGTQTTNINQRFISALDSAQSTTTFKYITLGRANTDRNAVDLGFYYSGLSSNANAFTIGFPIVGRKFTILADGTVGINTTNPDKQLEINSANGNCLRLTNNDSDGSATSYTDFSVSVAGQLTIMPSSNNANSAAGDILLKGSLIVGKDASNNLIRFNGVSGDADTNMTVIGECLYNGADFSELLLYKGNDGPGASGPDRIRHRAAAHVFQTYNTVEDYSTSSDNNTRLIIMNDGKIGISTTNPDKQLEINSTTGDCLRLTYNDNDGSASIYTDFSLTSGGTLRIKSNNNTVVIGDITNNNQRLLIGSDLLTATKGAIGLVNTDGVNYLQSGINTSTGSAADLVISNYNQTISASSRKIIFKSTGNIGFGTMNPDKILEINSATGDCLRLTYNSNNGSATTYCDIAVSSNGNTTFTTNGIDPKFTFSGGNINATLQTASQPNITSVGTLTSLTMAGAITGVTNLTMSGTLTTDTVSATNISGLLTTANQSNITDLGTLNGLKITNNLKIGNTGANAEDMIHLENSTNAFVGIQIENRNSTADTSGCKLSFMGYRDVNNAYELTRIASVTTTSDAPTLYQYGALAFYTRNNYLDANLTERMRIINNGNVGIGTTSPSYKLDVTGDIRSTNLVATNLTINSITLNGTAITATATQINYNNTTTLGTAEASKTLITDTNRDITNIRYLTTNKLLVGTSTDSASNRLISALDSAMVATTTRTITLGQANSAYNQAEMSFYYVGAASTSNRLDLGLNSMIGMSILGSGLVGIGTSSPISKLHVSAGHISLDNSYAIYGKNTSGTAEISFYPRGSSNETIIKYGGGGLYIRNNSDTNYLFINSSGSVGIGNTNPSYALDVSGSIRASSYLYGTIGTASQTNITSVGTLSSLSISGSTSSSGYIYTSSYIQASNGIYGTLQNGSQPNITSVGTLSSLSCSGNIGAAGYIGAGTYNPICPLHAATAAVIGAGTSFGAYAKGGYVGVQPDQNISVAVYGNGRMFATEFDATSDRRVKREISNLTEEFSKEFILKTNPVQFKFGEEIKFSYGYIAQDILKLGYYDFIRILPEETMKELIEEDGFVNPAGYKLTMNYNSVIPILAKNIQILYKENSELENKNTEMEEVITELYDQVNSLSDQVNELKKIVNNLINN
jgi:hypothetical protein